MAGRFKISSDAKSAYLFNAPLVIVAIIFVLIPIKVIDVISVYQTVTLLEDLSFYWT